MSFFSIIGTVLIKPLQLIFEVIYMIAERVIGNPGLSIIVLSLAMNFLVLPLYKRADAMQEEEREIELRLHKGVAHIKKTFRGDEKMMILQTFYRQNNYKPTYVLKGATSLFLEIPFFIAAYRFLSELELLHGVSFGPIADLGQPDGLLVIAGFAINILPIIMTVVNLISCVIFTKGSLLKTKIQLYSMAVFFFFFLYSSPSGLVFYWTLNNVFSLVKTIFYKLKNSNKILSVIASAAGVCLAVYGVFFYSTPSVRRLAFFVGGGLLLQIPLAYMLLKNKIKISPKAKDEKPNKKVFIMGAVFLALLTGMLIPSAVIKASPQEFVDINMFYHPVWYIVSAFCFAFGTFVVWLGIFYWLAKPAAKVKFEKAVWIVSGAAIINYMFFGKNLGNLSASLQYDNGVFFTRQQQLVNILVIIAAAVLLYFIVTRWRKHLPSILAVGAAALLCMSAVNTVGIYKSVNQLVEQPQTNESQPQFTLSRTGKNVVVLMLDRAVNAYIPYIFNEKPELQDKFEGFTQYVNNISFGNKTNISTPSLFGGYEYTPAKLNARDDEYLYEKQNEALKVMPVLFDQNDFNVTVFDPTYANYQWIPDLSIYNDYPDINKYITKGKYTDPAVKKDVIANNNRNFFCYSIMKIAPVSVQGTLYNRGDYNQGLQSDAGEQVITGFYTATGESSAFASSYNVLLNLCDITKITDENSNNFMVMCNDTTHDPVMLQEPDYVPAVDVDNTEYEMQNSDRFTLNGRTMEMYVENHYAYYQVNVAALRQIGNWLDYLRENGVYDNTRIILVSDHGGNTSQFADRILENGQDTEAFYPLLMVKDFDSDEFIVSDDFMTDADVPTIATMGLIENPVNPFTGNPINDNDKTSHDQYVMYTDDWSTEINNGTQFLPANWYTVHDDVRDMSNWKFVAKDSVLTSED